MNYAEEKVGGKFSSSKRFDRIDPRKIPAFPKTPYLPHNANVLSDDIIASEKDSNIIFSQKSYFEEKIDGSSVGIRLENGHFVVRNRNNILSKGYVKKETPAKLQFRSIWNFAEENRSNFEKLEEMIGFTPTVYGEWLYAKHTIHYNMLPSLFIAYDLYDFEKQLFVSPKLYRYAFRECGFSLPNTFGPHKECPPSDTLQPNSYEELETMIAKKSPWSDEKVEGVYIKVVNEADNAIISRFKIVRPDFHPDDKWNEKEIIKNKLAKE